MRSRLNLAVAAVVYGAGAAHGMPAPSTAPGAASDSLAEITVTARKRTENLQDVPQSIDVFTAKDLQNLAITRFEDYATKTPSVSFISTGPATQMFFMRGVSDGSNPNVVNTSSTGFFVDDMSMSFFGSIPDLHEYDIERIEILNGPQGTLFGAGSMSGAIRIITNKPDPNEFSAGVDADAGKIHSGGINSTYEGFVNLPIVEGKSAVRLSVYANHDGGFIDNLLTTRDWVNGVVSTNAQFARNNYNTQNIDGGRAAVKQIFNDQWNAVLTAGYQSQRHAGAWDQDPKYGKRKVSRFAPEDGSDYVKSLDLHIDGDVGIADLVFTSTYQQQTIHQVNEYSEYVQYSPVAGFLPENIQAYACLTDPMNSSSGVFSGCNVPAQYYVYDNNTQRWSNELRLQSKPGGRLQWLSGLYWEKTKDTYSLFYAMPGLQPQGAAYQSVLARYNSYYTVGASPLPSEWYSYKSRFDYLDTTEFADLTLNLTDRWSIEGGVQHYKSSFTSGSLYAGYFWNPKVPSFDSGGSHKVNAKAGVNFKAGKNLLLYGIFSQGFRDGGANSGLGATCYGKGAPASYAPDTLNNFEVGWKSALLDGRMTWNGAFYLMNWKGYQAPVFDLAICPSGFNANLGNARIYGAESNIDYQIIEGLSVQISGSYNDSHLITNTFQNADFIVVPGERLPFVPYFSFSANARYERPVGPALKGFVQYDIAHKGDMWSDLRVVDRHGFGRSLQPAYAISTLRVGVQAPSDRWSAEAYVSNLFDKNAVIYTNTANYDHRETTNEPRVIGLRLSYRWGKHE
ncbi:MAG TPA: TonB-dependent receptor [Steroidobacteraceae bacterium]|jgi:outer membrane receptor protein involved in Fe transport|nr:TonB-dependent receptor [Steroidobacteraceae bacterium]